MRALTRGFMFDSGLPRLYDLIVHPGADPSKITIIFKGQDSLAANAGVLTLKTSLGDMKKSAIFLPIN